MAQSGPGKIRLFNDFTQCLCTLALTDDTYDLGDFFAGGEGFEDNDAGIAVGTTAPLSGSINIVGANTDADTTLIGTAIMFDVALMAPIVMETRIQIPDLDTKEIFFGLTSVLTVDEQLEDIIINSSATAVSFVADGAGFYFSNELTASATEWHGFCNGTGAAKSITVADHNLGVGPTAGEWQVLRLEVDPDGTCRFLVDGVLKETQSAATSTTSNMAAVLAFAANTTELAIGECDYILVEANRDWTV